MKKNENYANETFPDFNNIEIKMNEIVDTIEKNFTNSRNIEVSKLQDNKNNKAKITDFFKSIDLCPNNSENKDYRGLYVFAKKKSQREF